MKKTTLIILYTLAFYLQQNYIDAVQVNTIKLPYFFFSPETILSYIKDYNSEEQEEILKDLEVVKKTCAPLQEKSYLQSPLYLATAGSPGTRKSTALERFMKRYVLDSNITYLDPDQRGLKLMSRTYYARSLADLSILEKDNYQKTIQKAYEKWRKASNYITFTLLEDALQKRQNIAHGTTSTAEYIPAFFSKLKEVGYKITLILCSCKKQLREDSIAYRNHSQEFYQLSEEDAISKAILFPKRMHDYFTYADSLYLFWSDSMFEQERLAAKLINGKLKIYDLNSYNKFIDQFNEDREGNESSWNELLKIYQIKYHS